MLCFRIIQVVEDAVSDYQIECAQFVQRRFTHSPAKKPSATTVAPSSAIDVFWAEVDTHVLDVRQILQDVGRPAADIQNPLSDFGPQVLLDKSSVVISGNETLKPPVDGCGSKHISNIEHASHRSTCERIMSEIMTSAFRQTTLRAKVVEAMPFAPRRPTRLPLPS